MFAGPIGDYLGRKWTICIGATIFILGGGLQTGAHSLSYLYAGRAIAGLGYVLCELVQYEPTSLTIETVSVSS